MTPQEYQKMLAANPDLRGPDYTTRTEAATSLRNAGDLGGATPAYRLAEAQTLHQPHRPSVVAQSIVLPLPVSANRYWRHYNGRTVVSDAAKAYKHAVWLQAQHAGLHPFGGPVAVYLHVYRARKVGDLDNANKVLLDALCGVAYHDDAQIVELHSYRHDDKANPRVEVEIREVLP